MSKSTRNHGFTIVELLIVIVVIGILAALVIVTFRGAIGRAQEASLQNDLRNGVNSIKAFHAVNGRFPTTVSHCPAPSGDSVCVKSSEGNGFVYVHDNSVTPNTFRLTAYNDTVAYRATENESAKKVARPGIATFNYTGSMQSWSVPAGISTLKLDVWGAQGGGSSGGLGGFASGELSVTSGDSLYVYVGGAGKDGPASQNVTGGWNGGGHAAQVDSATYGASGGGASDVRMAGTSFANRILVAGGGGGKGNIAGAPAGALSAFRA